jgi:DNA processing protein
LNTAGHAAALGRGLGAVPGPITSPGSAGTHRLIRDYGGAACITSADDVRELLGLAAASRCDGRPTPLAGDAAERTEDRGRTDDTTRVRDALSARIGRDAEDVARRAGMAVDDVQAMLGLLRLEGSVLAGADGWRLAGLHG